MSGSGLPPGYGGSGSTSSGFDPNAAAAIEKQLGLPAGYIQNMYSRDPNLAINTLKSWGVDPSTVIKSIADQNANSGAISDVYNALPPYLQNGGVQSPADPYHWIDRSTGTVYMLKSGTDGKPSWTPLNVGDSKDYINSIGGIPAGPGGTPGSSPGTRLAGDDPRYWQLQYDQLAAQYMNMGLDAESARRQALTTLIANRNNLSSDVANTSASVAKTAAEFAANPRDAVAELMYRNQVGGSTPFGDMTNKNFGEYGKALADKAASIFQPVSQDLNQARLYRDSIPPVDFFGAETRGQLGLPPTPAQQITGDTGATGTQPATAPAPEQNGLQMLMDRLNGMSDADKRSFREYVTGGNSPQPMAMGGSLNFSPSDVALMRSQMLNRVEGRHFENGMYRWRPSLGLTTGAPSIDPTKPDRWLQPLPPVGPSNGAIRMFANGGEMNFDSMFADRGKPGFSPSSSEGGTAMNLHERAVVVGESGHIYATLGEKRPDGSIRSESLQVKPLASEKKKDKALEDGKKAAVESQKQTLSHFDQGGTVNSTPDDFMAQLSQYLNSLGGSGGGTGQGGSSLPSLRLLAGAPANALSEDPVAQDYALAGYSALGIDPRTVQATIKKFTPQSPMNNIPRVSFA